MNENSAGPAMPVQGRRRRLGRSVFLLPSLFTVGNLFCGYYAVIATMHGHYDNAAKAIGIAIVLDSLDGRIARLTNSATGFGLQLDSLADVISFGIAPSILAFVWGLSASNPQVGWIATFTFTICGAMRLARFNIQAGHLKHFVGIPIPAAGGTIAAIVHFWVQPITWPAAAWAMVAVVFLLSYLMVSTIKYSSFKYLTLGKKSHLTVLAVALLFALIYFFSKWTLLALAIVYTSSGLLMKAYAMLRHRRPVEEIPVPHPADR